MICDMLFRAEDRVEVRRDLDGDEYYNNIYDQTLMDIGGSMLNLRGHSVVVGSVTLLRSGRRAYRLQNSTKLWTDDMFTEGHRVIQYIRPPCM